MSGLTRRTVGVRAALLVVVLFPLVSLVVFVTGAVRSAHDEVAAAYRTRMAGQEATGAAGLSGALSRERYWTASAAAIHDLGVEADVVAAVAGLDIPAELAAARAGVDELVAGPEQAAITTPLGAARRLADAGDFRESYEAYAGAQRVTDGVVARELVALRTEAQDIGDSAELLEATASLEASIALRSDAFAMTGHLFGSQFPAQALDADPVAALIATRARYDLQWDQLGADAAPASAVAAAIESIGGDPPVRRFLEDVDRQVEQLGVPSAPATGPDGLEAASDFADASAAVDVHGALVDAAERDLLAAGDAVAAHADRDQRSLLLGAGAVVAVTIAVLTLVGRWFVRSLDGISRSASAMNRGELDSPATVRGPREVRLTAEALNGAAANLVSAEAQALSLARGDARTTDVRPVPGRLGQSLQEAFDRLGSSLQEQDALRRELEHEASHDGLTGLPNRSAILSRLGDAVERADGDGVVAVLFIDLDNFKSINDLHGHDVGDRVLWRIGRRLRRSARAEDSVGRLGGDEFVMVATGLGGPQDAVRLAERVIEVVTRPVQTPGGTVTPEVSIGIATGEPGAVTPGRLLSDADLAVYQAKRTTGQSVEVCTPALRERSAHRLAVEGELREAIDGSDLALHYQAIVSARSLEFVGFEALVRWPRADGTSRAPGEFVPIAERSNLVIDLDRWVLGETLRRLAIWARSPATEALGAAVNISARHASTRGFATEIIRSLDQHGVDPHRLTVELTESALIDNEEQIISELLWLRRHGVDIALDDFGTGYTSLALLDRLPISTLKLDQTLTSDLGADRRRAVAGLIVETAHTIGMTVTAEGVETERQARLLRELGVDDLQGFHLHLPADATAAVRAAREAGYLPPVGEGDDAPAGSASITADGAGVGRTSGQSTNA